MTVVFDLSKQNVERRWKLPEDRKPLTRKEYAELFLKQDGNCPNCGQRIEVKGGQEVEIIDEHITPLWLGGSNELHNRELWCKPCTRPKTSAESTLRGKSNRIRDEHIGARESKTPMKCGRKSKLKKTFYHGVVDRETGEPIR